MTCKILIINPGSTTTKIGIFEDERPLLIENLKHSLKEIEQYHSIYDQFNFRKKIIIDILKEKNFDLSTLKAVVGRGGLLRPMTGGTYAVTDEMLRDLKEGIQGQHACNLGGAIANEIAKELGVPAYIVDPVVVDEMEEVARISGMPEIQRKSIFHALNQKAVARRYAIERGKKYEEINLIVAHIGGGVSVGAHKLGKVVDVNNALDGEGPFSPERSGGVPVGDLVKMCYSGKYTIDEIRKKITGKGGFVAYLNTNNAIEVDRAAAEGDEKAKLIFEAMAYQVAKEIGKCAPVLHGKVDAIILTGGMSYSKNMVDYVRKRVEFIAPVVVYPGEDEMLALAEGALRILKGEEKVKIYE